MTVGPQVYGFPSPDMLPQLKWLGPDYAGMLVRDLTHGLCRQDAGTSVLGVRCEGEPRLREGGGAHEAAFALQLFVRDGAGRAWRLSGRWTYVGLDRTGALTHHWELLAAEKV